MKKTVIALALVAASVSASAAPVSTWFYGISTQWNSAGFSSGSGTTSQTSNLVSWGGTSPSQRSSLAIVDSPQYGFVTTGGAVVDANDITHTNNAISSGYATPSSGTMQVNLGLLGLDAFAYAYVPYLFNFKFIETPNNGRCAWSNGNASNNCDDIFVLSGDTSKSFSYAGENYVASLGFDKNFIALGDKCNDFGFSAGCFALITDENAKTTGSMNLSVKSSTVPEPGTLALLGASLFGIAALRRRKTG
jgi:hypothetical protein